MRNNTFLFWVLFLVDGVFGSDKVISVSVMEGDSVTLRIDLTEIQGDSKIIWKFDNEIIAKIQEGNPSLSNSDERFRDRLKLDKQTGSLTVTNIRTEHAGVYSADVKTTIAKLTKFKVTVHGVFSDEKDGVKTVSEKTGTDVLLHTRLTEIEKDDPIEWTFGPQNISIAETDGKSKIISYNDTDVRFKNRLHLQTDSGDLTIKNANSEHSGLYQIKIINNTHTIQKRFSVTVSDSGLSSGAVAGIVGVLVVAIVVAVVIYYQRRISKLQKQLVSVKTKDQDE